MRRTVRIALLLLPWFFTSGATAGGIDLTADINACLDDNRYGEGGAMIGDCLSDLAETAEAEIADVMKEQENRYCIKDQREALMASQRQWLAYRDSLCEVVLDSPGNTVSYIRAGGCRLILARQKMIALELITEAQPGVDVTDPDCQGR